MTRHPSLAPALVALALLGLAGTLGADGDGPNRAALVAGPLVGHTTPTSTRIWLLTRSPGPVTLELTRVGGEPATRSIPAAAKGAAQALVIPVKDLAPGTEYRYRLLRGETVLSGPHAFRTFPEASRADAKVTLAFGSCAHGERFPKQPIFRRIAADRPDAFLFLGDTVYLGRKDLKSPAAMRERYLHGRTRPAFAELARRVPCYAMWDDHDYGPNNADRRWEQKAAVREIFKEFWPNPSFGDGESGVWTRFRLGPVEVFLLDSRSFRDPDRAPDKPSKTMLGAAQKAWLLAALESSEATFKLVGIGGQVLADYHRFDSYSKYHYERDELIKGIMTRGVQGVVFLTGDRHLSEILRTRRRKDRYPLYDITCSPLANIAWERGNELESPRRVFFYGKSVSYCLLTADRRELVVDFRDGEGRSVGGTRIRARELRLGARDGPY